MGKLIGITVDCEDPVRAATFWAAALDGYMTDASDKVLKSDGGGPTIYFQQVPESKVGANRVHIDIVTRDPAGEVFRLQRLGAKKVEHNDQDGHKWTRMLDIEGNEFCMVELPGHTGVGKVFNG